MSDKPTAEQLRAKIAEIRKMSRMNKDDALGRCNYSEAAVWKAWENCCRILLEYRTPVHAPRLPSSEAVYKAIQGRSDQINSGEATDA